MCGLCRFQHVFGNPLQGPSPVAKIKERAAKIKRLIRVHERYAETHAHCEATATRLRALRREQYDLAKNL